VVILSRVFLKDGTCRVPESIRQDKVSLRDAVV